MIFDTFTYWISFLDEKMNIYIGRKLILHEHIQYGMEQSSARVQLFKPASDPTILLESAPTRSSLPLLRLK